MRLPPVFLFPLLLAAASDSLTAEPFENKNFSARAELLAARQAAKSPAEKVALIDALLKAQTAEGPGRRMEGASFADRMQDLKSRPALPKPPGAREGLAWEVREGWKDTLAQARSPQEVTQLAREFRRLNAAALGELERPFPTPEEQRAQLRRTIARQSNRPGDVEAEIGRLSREIRAEARAPAETVALIVQFLHLNADALAEIRVKDHLPKSTP